ncbi:MAG: hypothetical protein MJ185_12805, partial [Treponema sp.]|nr:hypothetical protein [Treponema sp.]
MCEAQTKKELFQKKQFLFWSEAKAGATQHPTASRQASRNAPVLPYSLAVNCTYFDNCVQSCKFLDDFITYDC